jgi:hypothetical protein
VKATGKFLYKATGIASVVGCIKSPSWGDCTEAAALVAATVLTAGGDEVEIVAFETAEDIGADAAADAAADGAADAAVDDAAESTLKGMTRGEKAKAARGYDSLSTQLRQSLTKFMKKSPGAAEIPEIARLPEGAVEFSYKVPGRVPGSYAVYFKRVDLQGVTKLAYKTTFGPDGKIIHVKIK